MSSPPTELSGTAAAVTAELLARPALLHASWSGDGSLLAVTSTFVAVGEDVERVAVELLDVADGAAAVPRPLPGTVDGDRMAVFAPSGSVLAVVSSRGDQADRVWVVDAADGSSRPLEGTVGVCGPAVWSADGQQIAVPCRRGPRLDRTRPYRWTSSVFASDGIAALDNPAELCVVDVASGATRWIGDTGIGRWWSWSSPRWSPSGTLLAAVASSDPEGLVGGQRLRLIEVASGAVSGVDIPSGRSVVATWLADGRLAVLVAEPTTRPSGSVPALWIFDMGGGDAVATEVPLDGIELLGDVYGDHPAELGDSYDSVIVALDGSELLVRTGGGGRHGLARVDVDRRSWRVVADGQRCVSPVAVRHGQVVVVEQSADVYAHLAIVDLDNGSTAPLGPAPAAPMVEVRRLTVDNDGLSIDAWMLRAAGSVGRLPGVLMVHGGPHYTFGETFSIDAHALCAAGFAVVYCNPRGSTGYGDRFAHLVHDDWADGPTSDVLAVVDAAVASGWFDGDRLAVTGNSYGGYLTCWLACATTRFSAAVAENPVTDLAAMWGTSDIGGTFIPRQFGGTPVERPERFRSQSPLTFADRCRTPLLFVVGTEDKRCPPSQALAMHRALRVGGRAPSEVLVLPGSTHEGSTYGPIAGRLAHNSATVEWFERWVVDQQLAGAHLRSGDDEPDPR